MIVAQLRATIVMMPGKHGINTFQLGFLFQLTSQSFGHTIDTSHSGDNPYFVPDSHLAVLTDISVECTMVGLHVSLCFYRMIFVGKLTGQVCREVMLVHPLTSFQILTGMTNRVAVFDDAFAFLCISDKYLMTHGNILQ